MRSHSVPLVNSTVSFYSLGMLERSILVFAKQNSWVQSLALSSWLWIMSCVSVCLVIRTQYWTLWMCSRDLRLCNLPLLSAGCPDNRQLVTEWSPWACLLCLPGLSPWKSKVFQTLPTLPLGHTWLFTLCPVCLCRLQQQPYGIPPPPRASWHFYQLHQP